MSLPNYDNTKQKIIDTLVGRQSGTEIEPDKQQDYELQLLEYVRSVEMATQSPLMGVADESTTPVQPNNSRVSYVSTIGPEQTKTFTNFRNQSGQPITITSGEGESYFIILIWNGSYWTYETMLVGVIEGSGGKANVEPAGQGVDGIVSGVTEDTLKNTALNALTELFTKGGNMTYKDGKGVPYARKLSKFNFSLTAAENNVPYGVPFILDGTMTTTTSSTGSSFDYQYGWANKRQVFGLMMLVNNWCVAFDINHNEIWMKQIGLSSESNNGWKTLTPDMPLADGLNAGAIKSSNQFGNPNDIDDFVNKKYAMVGVEEGVGRVYIQSLKKLNFFLPSQNLSISQQVFGAPFYIYGKMVDFDYKNDNDNYIYGWDNKNVNALVFLAPNCFICFDLDTKDIWMKQFGSTAFNDWKRIGVDGGKELISGDGINISQNSTQAKIQIANSANLPGIPTANNAPAGNNNDVAVPNGNQLMTWKSYLNSERSFIIKSSATSKEFGNFQLTTSTTTATKVICTGAINNNEAKETTFIFLSGSTSVSLIIFYDSKNITQIAVTGLTANKKYLVKIIIVLINSVPNSFVTIQQLWE